MATHFGAELRRIRKTRKLTLAEVGRATGVSISTLSDIERGNSSPSLETINSLARYYAIPLQALLASDDTQLDHQAIPGFSEFMKQMGGKVNDNVRDLLIHVNYTARRPAVTKDDWLRNYYLLETIVG